MPELFEFETKRLRLRQWQESDLEPFAALNADPQVMEFFPEPLGRQASNDMAERIQRSSSNAGGGSGR